jgi:signal transduction histidine kinase
LNAARVQTAELRTALERQERFAALGRMAASVAHEVRNPIAAIRLKAENALAEPQKGGAALAFVLREVDRLENIVRALISRAEPVRIHSRDVKVEDWLSGRVGSFSEQCTAKHIKLRANSETATSRFDPDVLGRALDILIDNALDHTPEGGLIEVRAESRSRSGPLVVRVSDTGPGVAPEMRDRLFEPFVSGRANGVGLGLALAREIALAHGGALRHVEQTTGACFELEIPWPAS